MRLYDKLTNSITDLKENLSKDSYESVSSAVAAELTLILTILLLALLIRQVNLSLAILVVLILSVLLVSNMPLISKFKKEQDDSLEKMTFYGIITLGILVTIIYWGANSV
jgi:energy-converting hydrogenase B subunit G